LHSLSPERVVSLELSQGLQLITKLYFAQVGTSSTNSKLFIPISRG
jgi:hypothetical protein